MTKALGAAALVLGLRLGWLGYNLLVEPSPHPQSLPLLSCMILSPVCLYVGFQWLRGRHVCPTSAPRPSDTASRHVQLSWILRILRYPSERLLRNLSSDNSEEAQRATRALLKHEFFKMDLPRLYETIQRPWADDGNEAFSTRALLFRCLWKTHDAGTVEFIRNSFPTLPDNRDIRFAALLTLGIMNTQESLTAMMDLLERHKPDLGRHIGTLFRRQYETHRHADVLFPRLVLVMPSLEHRHEAYRLAINYRDHGNVIIPYSKSDETRVQNARTVESTDTLINFGGKPKPGPEPPLSDQVFISFRQQIVDDYHTVMSSRPGLDKGSDPRADNDQALGTLLNAMGSLQTDAEVSTLLRRCLEEELPQVALYAAVSLLRLGQNAPRDAIARIAACGATRLLLYEAFERIGVGKEEEPPPASEEPVYPPPSCEIEFDPPHRFLTFHFLASVRPDTVIRLVRELPPGRNLLFYDLRYPSPSDPGAYFNVQRHWDSYILSCGNHGWSRDWQRIDEGTLIRYIWGCRKYNVHPYNPAPLRCENLGLTDAGLGWSVPVHETLYDAVWAQRLISMPLVI